MYMNLEIVLGRTFDNSIEVRLDRPWQPGVSGFITA